jgi:predicted amidohydrolase
MSKPIRICAVNSEWNTLPGEANPFGGQFDVNVFRRYAQSNIEKMCGFLEEAGRQGADLVCTYEDFIGQGACLRMENPQVFQSQAEQIPGPTTAQLGRIAQQYRMYVAANLYERDSSKIYNTTVLIGRDGEIVGKYRKIHLPVCEKWMVVSGNDPAVFETEIGRIGFAVCYDIVFPEHCRALALQGADMILHPTSGWGISGISRASTGEALLRTRAAENSVYLVTAKNMEFGGEGKSCVIDNCGEIIAERVGRDEGIVTAEFTPDFDLVREDLFDTFFSGVDSIRARLAIERKPACYSALAMDRPPLLERYPDAALNLEPEMIKEISRQWTEYVQADIEHRPVNLDYHW